MLGKSFIAGVKSPVEQFLQSCVLRDPTLGLITSEKGNAGRGPNHSIKSQLT